MAGKGGLTIGGGGLEKSQSLRKKHGQEDLKLLRGGPQTLVGEEGRPMGL